jgi:SLT domain-containing protein
VVHFIQPAIALFLKLHGALFYLGIATTLVASFGSAMLKAAAATAMGNAVEATTGKMAGLGSAIGSLIGGIAHFTAATFAEIGALTALASEEGLAAAASKGFGDLMEAIPFGPVGIAVGLLAAAVGYVLYRALNKGTSAITDFLNAQNKMIAASNYANLQVDITNAIENTTAAINKSNAAASNYAKQATAAAKAGDPSAYFDLSSSMFTAYKNSDQLTKGLTDYIGQLQVTDGRQNTLNQTFGNANAAMTLYNLAGLNVSKIATESSAAFHQQIIELQGVEAGYGLMTTQAGAAGAQLDTLNISTSDAYKTLQTLTTAETGWLTLVTGGVGNLQSFESGMSSLSKVQEKNHGATLAQQSAFAAQVNSAGTLLGSLQSLSSALGNTSTAQNEVKTAMKGTIAQMLPFAKGSATNTTLLSNLAQLVGGPATSNFQVLAKWVGNTTNAQNDAVTATDKLTTANNNLSTASKNLATTLSSDITQAQGMAIMQNGLTSATNNFAHAMSNANGTLNQSVEIAAGAYYAAMIKAGVGTTEAKQEVDAFMKSQGYTQSAINATNSYLTSQSKKLGTVEASAIQAQKALQNYASNGPYNAVVNTTVSATGTVQAKGAGPGLNDVLAHVSFTSSGHFAGGGIVPGGSAGGDNHLAMVKSGELIIPSQHAPKFADMARTAGIAGYSSGGIVGPDTAAVNAVSGGTTTGNTNFDQGVIADAAKDMIAYAQNQMKSTGGGPSGGVATSAQVQSWIVKALQIDNAPAYWLGFMEKLVSLESAGNASAVDPIDVDGQNATGLAQMLPSTFAAHSLPGYGNIDNGLDNLVSSIRYIQAQYGTPAAIPGIGTPGAYKGYSAGGVTPEGILGFGTRTGTPYTIGTGEYVGPLMGNSASAMSMGGNVGLLIPILQEQNKLLYQQNQLIQGAPQQYANSLNNAVGRGAQRAFFASGG